MHWLSFFKTSPKKTFIVHGEPPAQLALQAKIKEVYGWDSIIPDFGEVHELPN
ncbi:MAG: MBL fold metallo-hydrolase RNA specificity domain-containing protein [Armatimonadota bacterium]